MSVLMRHQIHPFRKKVLSVLRVFAGVASVTESGPVPVSVLWLLVSASLLLERESRLVLSFFLLCARLVCVKLANLCPKNKCLPIG